MDQTPPAPQNGAPPSFPGFGAPQAPDAIDRLMAQASTQAAKRKRERFEVPQDERIMTTAEREVLVPGRGRCSVIAIWLNLLGSGEEKDVYKRATSMAAGSEQILGILEATEAMAFVELAPLRPVEVQGEDGALHVVETPILAEQFEVPLTTRDGSSEGMYAAMSPSMRKFVVLGYASISTPGQMAMALFMGSRKTVVR